MSNEETISEEKIEDSVFETSEDQTQLIIKFDELFLKPKLSVYNSFNLGAKRNFKMISNLIKETYEEIFLENGKFKQHMSIAMLQLLNVQSKIMKDTAMSSEQFIDLITKAVKAGDETLLKEIKKHVESGYQLTLDEDTKRMREKKKAVNDQLIITDEYAKIITEIAYLDRIMIPLISQYFIYNKASFPTKVSAVVDDEDDGEDMVFNEINQTIFNNVLFELVAKENTENIKNKIYKIVYARLKVYTFSAKKFWTIANDLGISINSASLDIYTKMISNSIPKIILSKECNVVNFFSTIVNNQINFLFSNKFRTHYQTINPSMTSGSMFEANDDNMTELEKMDIKMRRKNEGSLIIKDVIASEAIQNIDKYMDVCVTKEEIANTLKYIHMNPIQERIVALLSFKYFMSTDAIKRLTAYEYAKVLLCCQKYLEKQKYLIMPKLLMSNCIKQRDRTAITGVKIKTKIEETKQYRELLDVKYKNFKSEIERNIQSMISTIYNSTFIDEKGDDVVESSAKIGNIAEEIVSICYLI